MCDFCSNILPKEEYLSQFAHPYEEDNALVLLGEKVCLYVPCEDWYYSRCVMDVKYCPECGRKLDKNK